MTPPPMMVSRLPRVPVKSALLSPECRMPNAECRMPNA
jgi:hypothetical protein